MNAYEPLINGENFTQSDITINILNANLIAWTAINYTDEQDITISHGGGINPVGIGRGNYNAKASLKFYMSALESITKLSPITGRLQDIGFFDIGVSYITKDNKQAHHVIKNCQFKNNGRVVAQNDMNVEYETELICSHIVWNAL